MFCVHRVLEIIEPLSGFRGALLPRFLRPWQADWIGDTGQVTLCKAGLFVALDEWMDACGQAQQQQQRPFFVDMHREIIVCFGTDTFAFAAESSVISRVSCLLSLMLLTPYPF